MKKRLSFIFLGYTFCLAAAIAFVALLTPVNHASNVITTNAVTSYLDEYISQNSDELGIIYDNPQEIVVNGEVIAKISEDLTNFLPVLSVAVFKPENFVGQISLVSVVRLVGKHATTLSFDEKFNTPLSVNYLNGSPLPATVLANFAFASSGGYVVTMEVNSVVYTAVFDFNSAMLLDNLETDLTFLPNQTFEASNGSVNLFIGQGAGSFLFNLDADMFQYADNNLDFANASSVRISLEGDQVLAERFVAFKIIATGETVCVFRFVTVTRLPEIKYAFTAKDGFATDALTLYRLNVAADLPNASAYDRIFNDDVVPTLDLSGANAVFEGVFKLKIEEETKTESDTADFSATAYLVLDNEDETIAFTERYRINSVREDLFNIYAGGLSGVGIKINDFNEINSDTHIVAYETLHFDKANALTGTSIATDFYGDDENRTYIVFYLVDGVIQEAFAFEWTKFYPILRGLSITSSQNSFTVNIANWAAHELYPAVDLSITYNGQVFSLPDIFSFSDGAAVSFSLTEGGNYFISVSYRGTRASSLGFDIATANVAIGTSFITATVEGKPILPNQVVDKAVNVTATDTFSVYFNGNFQSSLSAGNSFIADKNGVYEIRLNNGKSFTFAVILTTVNSYTLFDYSNVMIGNIFKDGDLFEFEEETDQRILTEAGIYGVEQNITCRLQIILASNGEQMTLVTVESRLLNLRVAPVSFQIDSSVGNGQRTSANVVINDIIAYGDWTVAIDINGKVRTYTRAEFEALSGSQRTFSTNGRYRVLVTDENGLSYSISFEKYFQLDPVAIVLIILGGCGLLFAVFMIFRIKFKQKVR